MELFASLHTCCPYYIIDGVTVDLINIGLKWFLILITKFDCNNWSLLNIILIHDWCWILANKSNPNRVRLIFFLSYSFWAFSVSILIYLITFMSTHFIVLPYYIFTKLNVPQPIFEPIRRVPMKTKKNSLKSNQQWNSLQKINKTT